MVNLVDKGHRQTRRILNLIQANHMRIHHGIFLTPEGFREGNLRVESGRVAQINGDLISETQARESGQAITLPGFIDLHVHGAGGRDFMEGADACVAIARRHTRFGTTALLATTMTAPEADIRAALAGLAPAITQRAKHAAQVLGVHLEGPYLNPGKLGAQPDFAVPATLPAILALHAIAPLRVITLAPEIAGNLELIPQLVALGLRVQIGHSLASYEDGCRALECGAHGFTHLFNAMTPLHHRDPGLVGAALAHARHAEIIPDLLHVHPGAIRAALRAIPGLYCVTDSTAATGMPDGDYQLGRQTVSKCMGGVRLADGTLAGSTLTMDQAVRNLVSIGLSLQDASRRVATLPADYLSLTEHGRLTPGALANFVVLDPQLAIEQVVVEGEEIDLGG
jgi:N-acetylglucosamine-6-phosphate deacetylase